MRIFMLMKHEHYFEEKDGFAIMNDTFNFESPLGIFRKLADHLFPTQYLTKLLIKRNQVIKEFAESEQWKFILNKN